jgi:hypothetical protein
MKKPILHNLLGKTHSMNTTTSLRLWLLGLFAAIYFSAFGQTTTEVRGRIVDANNDEAMPYATVKFDGTNLGTISDINGNFRVQTQEQVSTITVTLVGYKPVTIKVNPGRSTELTVRMEESGNDLKEVVVKSGKYRNKGNPAVELIQKAIDNKDKNRKEALDFYNFEKYEKVQFALNNVTDKMKNNLLFRRINFIFDNVDTNRVTGDVSLPFFLRETVSDVYFRKSPEAEKEYIRGERNSTLPGYLDNQGLSASVENIYQDVDFYKNAVNLVTMDFMSPLAPSSPIFYRFYILDTVKIGGTPCAHMYFAPRQKSDLGFMGYAWIALDSTYALRKIEVGIPKDANLNWVNEMQINQEFDWAETPGSGRALMLVKDEIFMDFGLTKSSDARSFLGRKITSYRNYHLNEFLPDTLFRTKVNQFRDVNAELRDEQFWAASRHDTLSSREQGIYKMVDSLNNYKPFRRLMGGVKFLFEGYTPIGGFDVGPANTFYSFNQVEGFRARLGGRTNLKFHKRIMLETYAAYGFKDETWKGYAAAYYNFGSAQTLRFPLNQLKIWYQDDVKIPGQNLQFVQEDNFFLSFKRGVNDKMYYVKTLGSEYINENQDGFSYTFGARNIRYEPGGILRFDYQYPDGVSFKEQVNTTEFSVGLRYAPNEKFYQGATYRTPFLTKYPIFNLDYTAGVKNLLGSEYNYHRVSAKIYKGFFISPIGWSIATVEAGRVFGQVPYPLLVAHRANQTYAYQLESYNLMNFLEFISDKYVSINLNHNFGGFFFNRVPLLRRLKWREVITAKVLWGGLDDKNRPGPENGLLLFPVDANGNTITYTLDKQPYIEASVGIANLVKFVRVDLVRRLTYTDNPGISKMGIRMRFKLEF